MIPLGPVEFSPADVALILAVLAFGAVALALPATLTLAWVGHRRATAHKAWNAVWYWFCGTGLSVGTTFATAPHIGWWAVPLGWIPTVTLAWVLNPRSDPEAS
ncbi:hypothetical protein GCM10009630_38480 [Kribbella jejuensis]|uniref:Uncharacterized protein n=1 Tax=Kribbella jejuensis TaxID=236068 RepID=A0A542ES66_9ACTN|nr:hypothetical protein [Kribbella jejuensis]TQJ18198.1 hypothetical protein FB475_2333 [Kribbella jejuensis]